jgi:SAM-dependent methyltransferase
MVESVNAVDRTELYQGAAGRAPLGRAGAGAGAGWDPEFHRGPFRELGARAFYAQDLTSHDGAAIDFVGDLCAGTDIPDELAGTVLLFNVLEHVYAPWLAADEAWRVLQPDGLLIGSVPFRTAIHRHDRDYWRVCPDGLAYLLRRFRLVHFAVNGNCGMPANLLWAAVKDKRRQDWAEENQRVVLRPEVIVGGDYTTTSPWKQRLLDTMRRRLGLSLELWDGPWDAGRMRDLGFEDWTVRAYPG